MHHCLSVTELLDVIMSEFIWRAETDSKGPSDPLCGSTLLALALTCKTFQQPALNALWNVLSSPVPLVMCLDRNIWEEKPLLTRHYSSRLVFKQLMSLQDVDALLCYTKRVRHVYFQPFKGGRGVPGEAIGTLMHATTTPLFPNLRTLSWLPLPVDETHSLFRLYLGPPHLESLRLHIGCTPFQLSIIPYIQVTHTQIKQCHITDNSVVPSPFAREAISSLIISWDNLESLTCARLTTASLVHLMQLRSLRKLDFALAEESIDFDFSPSQMCFPALEELRLTALSLAYCYKILDHTTPSTITTISVFLNRVATLTSDIEEFFKYVSHFPLLASLSLEEEFSSPPQFPIGYVIQLATIKPLFALSGLRCLKINTSSTFSLDLDERALKQMGAAWPELQILSLGGVNGWRRRPTLTLIGLAAILASFPKLNTLGIAIDATKIEECSTERPGLGVRNESVTRLELADSKLREPTLVAAFLSDILPCVTSIDSWSSIELASRYEASKYGRRWAEVEKLLKTMSMVRT
ncbi:hypothetical protein FIBSPDRAFT_952113 [Athelia psychrophila]|uniref:F-box domain-containing protein n=1 Tax=Athelia psychrophila TaxID=1759441 RepID=A0A166LTQ9_9AGAM|nr:hypothetical protein FIBSPDRAFT_952113 [Fibularhizoctonia sp. CBS 109695]